MQTTRIIPQPTEYLDPLTDIDSCYYYAVPKYFHHGHPNTRWLMGMIMHNRAERVLRKMELTPRLFRDAYYQLLDDPKVYWGKRTNEHPAFHKKAVLYVTTVAAAIYLGHENFVETMLQYRDIYDAPLHSVDSVQYATHVHDTQNGDLHAFNMYTVTLRRCKFACLLPMLRQGWDPLQSVAMPLRRRHERRALYFNDWLDYALWLLFERPTYPLSALVLGMARDPMLWSHPQLPIQQLLRTGNCDKGGGGAESGLVNVDDLPISGPRMLGVKSLAELVKDYDKFQQAKMLRNDVLHQISRIRALGCNRERLLAQCQDFSAAFIRPPEESQSPTPLPSSPSRYSAGRNNSAKRSLPTVQSSAIGCSPNESGEQPYASEPVRILYYMLERDRHGKSVRQCLDAVDVYVRRNFYLTSHPMQAGTARLRDLRNAVVLLLNLTERQMSELRRIALQSVGTLYQSGGGGGAVSGFIQSRRLACLRSANKLIQLMTRMLLHSKEFVQFALRDKFPPYQPAEVDFPYAEGLTHSYADIRLGVAREFNTDKHSCRYLTLGMLQELQRAASHGEIAGALRLRLKLGQPPSAEALAEADAEAKEGEAKEKSGCGKKLSCRKSSKRGSIKLNNSNYNVGMYADWRISPPRVTFVRVGRKKNGRLRKNTVSTAAATTADCRLSTTDSDIELFLPADATPDAFDQRSEGPGAQNQQLLTPLPSGWPFVDGIANGGASADAPSEAAASPASRTQRRGVGALGRWLVRLRRRVWHSGRARGKKASAISQS